MVGVFNKDLIHILVKFSLKTLTLRIVNYEVQDIKDPKNKGHEKLFFVILTITTFYFESFILFLFLCWGKCFFVLIILFKN